MKEELFRKKSLDRISSPESLNEYVKVASPSMWLLIGGIILLLLGVLVWGIFGHIDSVVKTQVYVQNGNISATVGNTGKTINTDQCVIIEKKEYSITKIEPGLDGFVLTLDGSLTDGIYEGKIIIESINPISLIFN